MPFAPTLEAEFMLSTEKISRGDPPVGGVLDEFYSISMIIELPQVGESVTEGVIGKWLKSIGDRVERFDPLVEVVTDKVNMEMPSPVSGTLTAVLAAWRVRRCRWAHPLQKWQ